MPIVIERLGSSTRMAGSGRGSSGSARVSPMVTSAKPATATISPGPASSDIDPVEGLGGVELGDLAPLHRSVEAAPAPRSSPRRNVPLWTRQMAKRPTIGRGIEVGDQRLERDVGVVVRAAARVDDGVEQRNEVGARRRRARCCAQPGAGVGVEDGEADLVLVGVEVQEELLDLVDDLCRLGRRAGPPCSPRPPRQPGLERLAQHEAGLGQRALRRVDQEEHAVDHGQAPLDLTTEVGVPRRVDDGDLGRRRSARRCAWRGW